jgi:hypothetical protein
VSKRPVHLASPAASAFGRAGTMAVAGLIVLVALSAVQSLQGSGVATAATGRGAARCGPLTAGGTKVRFLLYGGVPCGTATSVYKTYVREASQGRCEGNGCYAKVDGWDCVEQIAAPVQEETGEIANCEKGRLGVRVFRVGKPAQGRDEGSRLSLGKSAT